MKLFLVLVAVVVCGCSSTLTTKTCTSNVHCKATEYCQRQDVYVPGPKGDRVWRDGRCQPDTK